MSLKNKKEEDEVRKRRIGLLQQLKLKIQDSFQRAHTATGVWRRKDLLGDGADKADPRKNVHPKSLDNLRRRKKEQSR